MRGLAALVVLLAVVPTGGCRNEPDFDERYEATEQKIREMANEIDTELEKRTRAEENASSAPATPAP